MRLRLDMPTVYGLQPDDAIFPRQGDPKWMNWGWCKAEDVAEIINHHYGLTWDAFELVERFGVHLEIVPHITQGSKFGLRVLTESQQHAGRYIMSSFSQDCLQHLRKTRRDFLIPAGWVKEVMCALYNGGRKLVVLDGAIGIFTEDNQPLYLW